MNSKGYPRCRDLDQGTASNSSKDATREPQAESPGQPWNPRIVDLHPPPDTVRRHAVDGLGKNPKSLPCWLLYDARGSELFELITTLEEYYPTRTEIAILNANLPGIANLAGPARTVVEIGSGSPRKAALLLKALHAPRAYAAIELSLTALAEGLQHLRGQFPGLPLVGIRGDYNRIDRLPISQNPNEKRLFFFPGSTLGNLSIEDRRVFFANLTRLMRPGDQLLLGIDLHKDERILVQAYNDAMRVTAAFNLNILTRLNRELNAGFDLDCFRHMAIYNRGLQRIEMHLESLRNQTVEIDNTTISFRRNETIHTENSYKFDAPSLRNEAGRFGLLPRGNWQDARNWFSVELFECGGRR
jgi:L-histidine Nalpha-methyltransferase